MKFPGLFYFYFLIIRNSFSRQVVFFAQLLGHLYVILHSSPLLFISKVIKETRLFVTIHWRCAFLQLFPFIQIYSDKRMIVLVGCGHIRLEIYAIRIVTLQTEVETVTVLAFVHVRLISDATHTTFVQTLLAFCTANWRNESLHKMISFVSFVAHFIHWFPEVTVLAYFICIENVYFALIFIHNLHKLKFPEHVLQVKHVPIIGSIRHDPHLPVIVNIGKLLSLNEI